MFVLFCTKKPLKTKSETKNAESVIHFRVFYCRIQSIIMSNPQKYIPPHLRARGASAGPRGGPRGGHRGGQRGGQRGGRGGMFFHSDTRSHTRTTQGNYQERFGYRTDEEFVVTLKSKKNYEDTDMPSPLINKAVVKSGILNYKFSVGFQEDKLRELLRV